VQIVCFEGALGISSHNVQLIAAETYPLTVTTTSDFVWPERYRKFCLSFTCTQNIYVNHPELYPQDIWFD
jgi:hypothetical protein